MALGLLWWLADSPSPVDSLWQYGAVGILAIILAFAVRVLFARQVAAHNRDIDRADKAEQQLAELNELIRTQLVEQLVRATDAIGRVADLLQYERWRQDPQGSRPNVQ